MNRNTEAPDLTCVLAIFGAALLATVIGYRAGYQVRGIDDQRAAFAQQQPTVAYEIPMAEVLK